MMQERNASLLKELRAKEAQMQDVEWDLNRELRLRAETKIGKARIETEIDKMKRENAELKESLAMAETLRIKHQEMIAQFEFANRERDRA